MGGACIDGTIFLEVFSLIMTKGKDMIYKYFVKAFLCYVLPFFRGIVFSSYFSLAAPFENWIYSKYGN